MGEWRKLTKLRIYSIFYVFTKSCNLSYQTDAFLKSWGIIELKKLAKIFPKCCC